MSHENPVTETWQELAVPVAPPPAPVCGFWAAVSNNALDQNQAKDKRQAGGCLDLRSVGLHLKL